MMHNKLTAVCRCGHLLETRNPVPGKGLKETKEKKCPACKKNVIITYTNTNATVAYKK